MGERRNATISITSEDLAFIVDQLRRIGGDIAEIKQHQQANLQAQIGYIRPADFMKAVGIKRTKFNSLVASFQIKSIKKGRKLYIPVSEISRYFSDPSIE